VRDDAASDGAARWRDYSVNCLARRRAAGTGFDAGTRVSRAGAAPRL